MATIAAFLPQVAIDVAGCPTLVMEAAVRRAAIRFCEETLALVYEVPAFDAAAGQPTYALTPPADHAIHTTLMVKFDGAEVPPAGHIQVLRSGQPEPDVPVRHWLEGVSTLRLWGAPAYIAPIEVSCAIKPAADATTLDDSLMGWEEAIAAYAKYWLARQPNKAWSNPELAKLGLATYRAEVGRARALNNTGRASAQLRVAMRPIT